MIASLRGQLTSFAADHAVIEVGGIGYQVFASTRTIAALGAVGDEVLVHTQMLVSEDDIRLMIGVLLPKAAPQSDDAADALAIAVCHAHHRAIRKLSVPA